MPSISSREVIKILEKNGWNLCRTLGSHNHFRHSYKKGTVTVPHPKKDLPRRTVNSIGKQAGIEELIKF